MPECDLIADHGIRQIYDLEKGNTMDETLFFLLYCAHITTFLGAPQRKQESYFGCISWNFQEYL